jgi:hypothetical protein
MTLLALTFLSWSRLVSPPICVLILEERPSLNARSIIGPQCPEIRYSDRNKANETIIAVRKREGLKDGIPTLAQYLDKL